MRATPLFDTDPGPLDPWQALAAGVIVSAWKDLWSRDAALSLDAALFFSGPVFGIWAEVLELGADAGLQLLAEGKRHVPNGFRSI